MKLSNFSIYRDPDDRFAKLAGRNAWDGLRPAVRKRIILAENEITRGLPGKYVDTFAFPDGRFEVRWKVVSIPYSVFDKDQRVTHAAPKKRRAGKQSTRYQPTGKRNDGWNSKLAKRAKKQAEAPPSHAAE